MSNIKKCPFCGNNEVGFPVSSYGVYMGFCYKCAANGPVKKTRNLAKKEWNRRANDRT